MNRRLRLLDLFCCAGGAGEGYARAGFDVIGVDVSPQPRYPHEFHQADAIAFVLKHGREFDVIHASPPCQVYSITANSHSVEHPDLLAPARDALIEVGQPYIIENVVGAPLQNPVMLCGTMFGLSAPDVDGVELQLQRHRLFETSFPIGLAPAPCAHDSRPVGGSYKGSRHRKPEHRDNPDRRGGYTPAISVRGELLGIDWMNEHELAQVLGRILKPWPSPHGYPLVNLSFNGRRRCYPVHVLVCEAWHGPRPPGMLARHLDDVPDHIWPENIAWGTPLDNAQDAIRNGRNVLLKRVECKRGHPYDDRNTYFDRRGHRRCRACAAQYFRERRARIKEERKERGS